ncbi:SpoIVB peptidase. Serine peptidase. MEROPS family S55 [Clostridium cavendishii DSM 21758]|uniref:SpoIVB peptidase. Serine peptidase. MEROPS family S55 n=1 Tax=Clostridium cavendishii DSM 21758 TaxID=1121302 RepID=A0A1M6KIV5_9CLOT|nr:SpoIVB peptidase [Clostridium cavendishii]SHJ58867.1 SpoIVB peptidase. Serine peptidase. MEROPS family S55 [Clostridium cavendishii DSM 21758]
MNKKKFFNKLNFMLILLGLFLYVSSSISYESKSLYLSKSNNILPLTTSKNANNEKKLINKYKETEKTSIKPTFSKTNEDLKIYAGGNPVGVKISTEGVIVVGYSNITINDKILESPGKLGGIELGDTIIKIDNFKIQDSKDLSNKLKKINKQEVNIEINRKGEIVNKKIKTIKVAEDESIKIGLWVRDSTAGVGTMTFYDVKNNKYGALGHPITDNDTNVLLNVKDGKLIKSSIISVKKGEKGAPGELKGIFISEENPLGNVKNNTQCGIFGEIDGNKNYFRNQNYLKVGFRDEVKEGKAQIITTIDEEGPKAYDIEIIKLLPQDIPGPKSMVIKVTDEELLKKTGGIVQGMSGSPIIQDKKIIGAVTHVLVNKPDVGYGIYIEWMLKDAGIIN